MHHGQNLVSSRRASLRLTAVLAAAALAVAGCTPSDPAPAEEPVEQSTLSIGVVGSLTSFNAATVQGDTAANRAVSALLDESLGSLDGDLQVVPNQGLGRITRIEGDPLTVLYEIFPDRTWSDGTPVSVDDLLFGWAVTSHWFDDATYDQAGRVVSGTRYFDTVAQLDDIGSTQRPTVDRTADTLTLTYDQPFADWNRQWLLDRPVHVVAERAGVSVTDLMDAIRTLPAGDPAAPVEPDPVLAAAAEAWNTGFDVPSGEAADPAAAVSAGPWRVAAATPSEVSLERRDDYQGDHYPGMTNLTVRFYADRAAQVTAVESGEVDVANVGDLDAAEQKALDDAGVGLITGPTTETLQLRFARGTDPSVRQALSLALDRDEIVADAVRDVRPDAQPLQSFLSSPATGELYTGLTSGNGAPGTGADVDAARSVLEDRAAAVRVAYDTSDTTAVAVFAQMVAMGAEAGIAVRAAAADETPEATLAWVGEDESLYRSARDRLAEGVDPTDAVRAFAQLRIETDPVGVLERAKEIDRAMFGTFAGVPLLERTGAVAVREGVTGVAYTSEPDGVPPAFWQWAPAPAAS